MYKIIILVYTSHYYPDSEYTEYDVWKFTWDGKHLMKSDNPGTLGEYNTLDEVFEKIRKYFYGTNYKIIDIKPGR